MKIIICGAGQVGFNIAKQLANQQNDVTVIDNSASLIRKVSESLDVQAIEGYASDPDVLERANASDADMVVAVTQSDEVNMIACQVAHSLFNVPTKIARVRNRSYLKPIWSDLFSRDHLPIDMIISPEAEVAKSIAHRLAVPGTFEMLPFVDGKVSVIGIRLGENCPVVDTPLRQLNELFPDLNITIMAIFRGTKIIMPDADDQMQVGDSIYFAADKTHVPRAMAIYGHDEKEARRLIIIGGGNVGLFLASELETHDPSLNVKIIEQDPARAEFVASQLKNTVVIIGDGLDSDILKEANAGATETVISVTNEDEVNILSSLLAKRLGALRAITLVNNRIFTALMSSLGIDVYVNPRETTVSNILQRIRRGRIRGLHSIRDGAAEILDAEALETSPLIGIPIKNMKLPRGVMISAICRGDEVIMPRGNTEFKEGDRVIMLVLADDVKKVEQLFSVRLEYF
jgi:trk system potassium uptake protein TrkA